MDVKTYLAIAGLITLVVAGILVFRKGKSPPPRHVPPNKLIEVGPGFVVEQAVSALKSSSDTVPAFDQTEGLPKILPPSERWKEKGEEPPFIDSFLPHAIPEGALEIHDITPPPSETLPSVQAIDTIQAGPKEAGEERPQRKKAAKTWVPEADAPVLSPEGAAASNLEGRPGELPRTARPFARLEILQGDLPQKVLPITKERYVIGRGRDADLQLLNTKVSRHHAHLRFSNGAWFIQDQESTSGILVNGQSTKATRLKSGDEITIINYVLKFRTE